MSQNKKFIFICIWSIAGFALSTSYNACSQVGFEKMSTLQSQSVDVGIGNNKVDILVVVDNSASMESEMTGMATRFMSFMDKIKYLDWQLGFTTTDNRTNVTNGNGRLVPLNGLTNQYILSSAMTLAQAQQTFGSTIQMPTNGSGSELGLAATVSAINRSVSSLAEDAPNKALIRDSAALAVILISDAADTSTTTALNVIDAVKNKLGNHKTFSFNSIVIPESSYTTPGTNTKNPNDPCKNYRETAQLDGRKYHELSQLTGGVKGNACSEDYGSQLSAIGQNTAELINSVTLSCQPVDANSDGVIDAGDVEVRTPNGVLSTGYQVNGRKLTFTDYLPVGRNELVYRCII